MSFFDGDEAWIEAEGETFRGQKFIYVEGDGNVFIGCEHIGVKGNDNVLRGCSQFKLMGVDNKVEGGSHGEVRGKRNKGKGEYVTSWGRGNKIGGSFCESNNCDVPDVPERQASYGGAVNEVRIEGGTVGSVQVGGFVPNSREQNRFTMKGGSAGNIKVGSPPPVSSYRSPNFSQQEPYRIPDPKPAVNPSEQIINPKNSDEFPFMTEDPMNDASKEIKETISQIFLIGNDEQKSDLKGMLGVFKKERDDLAESMKKKCKVMINKICDGDQAEKHEAMRRKMEQAMRDHEETEKREQANKLRSMAGLLAGADLAGGP